MRGNFPPPTREGCYYVPNLNAGVHAVAKSLTKIKSAAAAKRGAKPLMASGAAARKVSAPTVPSRAAKAKAAPPVKPAKKTRLASPTPARKAAKSPPKAVAPAVAAKQPALVAPLFSVGQRITHRMFGPGVVLTVDGDKLEIKFKSVGVKWIAEEFVSSAGR